MQRSIVGFFLAVILSLIPAFTAVAAQDEVFLAQMKVVREIDMGSFYEYEVETAGRGRAILKTAPYRLKVGEAINLFVVEGVKENGKPAYMTLKGGSTRSFREGFAAVNVGDRWHLIDKNGRLLVQGGFKEVSNFNEGFAFASLKKGYAFFGKDGKVLNTPFIRPATDFRDAFDSEELTIGFGEGRAIVATETTEGKKLYIIIDKTGAVVERLSYTSIVHSYPFSEGLSAVAFMMNWAYVNTKGETTISDRRFANARSFKEGLGAVEFLENPSGFKGKWGFIDKGGNFVIEPKYDYAQSFSEGLAAVKAENKWGFIDKSGKVVVNMAYDEARPFSEGVAAVRRGNVWGCIDKNGQVVVKFLFSGMKPFVNGLAPAINDDVAKWKWGYIDKKGNFAIKPQYDSAQPFSEGLAVVSERTPDRRGYKWKYINTKGQAALWFYMYEY